MAVMTMSSDPSEEEQSTQVTEEPEPSFTIEDVTLESGAELLKHGERILPGISQLIKYMSDPKREWVVSTEAKNFAKWKQDKQKNSVKEEVVEKWGRSLRRPFSVITHVKNFLDRALIVLKGLVLKGVELDFSWNYAYTTTVFSVFGYYVKVHMMLAEIPNVTSIVPIYKSCMRFFCYGKSMDFDGLSKFVEARMTLKPVETELHFMAQVMMGCFKRVLPSLQIALTSPSTFPWKTLLLSEKPRPFLEGEIFFKIEYVVFMHIRELVEWYTMFALLFIYIPATDALFMDALQLVNTFCGSLNLYGEVVIDIKTAVAARKKEVKKLDIDASAFDCSDRERQRRNQNQGHYRRRLIMVIQEFCSACGADVAITCVKHPIAFAIMGFTSFQLQTSLSLISAKSPMSKSMRVEMSTLLFWFSKLVTIMSRSLADIERFFLFNLREYDAFFLDTMSHAHVLPQDIFTKMKALIGVMKSISVSDADQGRDVDVYPCISLVRSVITLFNRYSTKKGISHLSLLLQLLSGTYLRLQCYQSGFETLLSISKIHLFWWHRTLLVDILTDVESNTGASSCVLFMMIHFWCLDQVGIGEIAGLGDEIKKIYNQGLNNTKKHMIEWFVGAKSRLPAELKPNDKQTAAFGRTGDEKMGVNGSNKWRELMMESDRQLHKLSAVIMAAQKTGIIYVLGERHDVGGEIRAETEAIVQKQFETLEAQEPLLLIANLRLTRDLLQVVCTAAMLPFAAVWHRHMASLAMGSDGQPGCLVHKYCKQYVNLASDCLPNAMYSTVQGLFVPLDVKSEGKSDKEKGKHIKISSYMSGPALHALSRTIGEKGILVIYQQLGLLAGNVTARVAKIFASVRADKPLVTSDTGVCAFPEAEAIIKGISHVSAVLQLREMMRPFTGIPPLKPGEDEQILDIMLEAGVCNFVDIERFTEIIGTLLSSSYWEKFNYSSAHDSVTDNCHIWARAIDIWAACAAKEKKILRTDLLYRLIIQRCLNGIVAGTKAYGSKKALWPGMNLMFIVDHLVAQSNYADYQMMEELVTYQYIRTLYTTKLSEDMVKGKAKGKGKDKK